MIAVYVDDIVLAGKSERKLSEVKNALAARFDVKDLGKLHYFVGVKVVQDQENVRIWIGQPAYTDNVLVWRMQSLSVHQLILEQSS